MSEAQYSVQPYIVEIRHAERSICMSVCLRVICMKLSVTADRYCISYLLILWYVCVYVSCMQTSVCMCVRVCKTASPCRPHFLSIVLQKVIPITDASEQNAKFRLHIFTSCFPHEVIKLLSCLYPTLFNIFDANKNQIITE